MKLITYVTKPSSTEENRGLIAGVAEALGEAKPAGLRYLVIETEDGRFLHFVESETHADVLSSLPAFRSFTMNLRERQSAPLNASGVKVLIDYESRGD